MRLEERKDNMRRYKKKGINDDGAKPEVRWDGHGCKPPMPQMPTYQYHI